MLVIQLLGNKSLLARDSPPPYVTANTRAVFSARGAVAIPRGAVEMSSDRAVNNSEHVPCAQSRDRSEPITRTHVI